MIYNPNHPANNQSLLLSALLVTTTLTLAGCASTEQRPDSSGSAVSDDVSAQNASPVDPYENFNRSMYGFNMGVDRILLKPVADGYKAITPTFFQTGVSNFFTNLKGINVVLNDLLQGKFGQSASDVGRFTTNTTLGVAGLFDVASELGFENNNEDFGQTLAVWGVDQGPYLVLPLMGPTTLRDGSAVILDKAANPGTYLPGTGVLEGISDRANAEGALNFINEAAMDPYVFMRESFLQYRTNQINDGKIDVNSYELDLDEAIDETDSAKTKPKAEGASKAKPADIQGRIDNPVQANPAHTQLTDSFESMSQSFDSAEKQFELAADKLDAYSASKKKRSRRR